MQFAPMTTAISFETPAWGACLESPAGGDSASSLARKPSIVKMMRITGVAPSTNRTRQIQSRTKRVHGGRGGRDSFQSMGTRSSSNIKTTVKTFADLGLDGMITTAHQESDDLRDGRSSRNHRQQEQEHPRERNHSFHSMALTAVETDLLEQTTNLTFADVPKIGLPRIDTSVGRTRSLLEATVLDSVSPVEPSQFEALNGGPWTVVKPKNGKKPAAGNAQQAVAVGGTKNTNRYALPFAFNVRKRQV